MRHVPGAAERTVKRAASRMGRRRAPELYRAPFPLYALQVDPSTGLLIAAGGGGAAKTGIKNGVVRAQGQWGRVTPGVMVVGGLGDGRTSRPCLSAVGSLGFSGAPARISAKNLSPGTPKVE